MFQKLHQKCCELRDPGADDDEEVEKARLDEEYSEEVTSKVYPVMDQFVEYTRSLAKLEAKRSAKEVQDAAAQTLIIEENKVKEALINSIPQKEKKYEEALEAFQISKENALQIVKCLDNLTPDDIFESSLVQIQPADSAKESLSKDFKEVATSANELRSAMEARGDEATVIGQKIKFDRT